MRDPKKLPENEESQLEIQGFELKKIAELFHKVKRHVTTEFWSFGKTPFGDRSSCEISFKNSPRIRYSNSNPQFSHLSGFLVVSPDAAVARQITAPAVMQVADYYLRSATWLRFSWGYSRGDVTRLEATTPYFLRNASSGCNLLTLNLKDSAVKKKLGCGQQSIPCAALLPFWVHICAGTIVTT